VTAAAAAGQRREPVTPHIRGFKPVILILVDVAPVDTAHRYQLTRTELLSCLHHE
jgi:hypothetical protein